MSYSYRDEGRPQRVAIPPAGRQLPRVKFPVMVRDFFSKLLSSEISSFVRISVTAASLYPGFVSAEYCLHDYAARSSGLNKCR
jgi:hypothetical protein